LRGRIVEMRSEGLTDAGQLDDYCVRGTHDGSADRRRLATQKS
jgi:hypothetical protein